jgi:hypothetical protein
VVGIRSLMWQFPPTTSDYESGFYVDGGMIREWAGYSLLVVDLDLLSSSPTQGRLWRALSAFAVDFVDSIGDRDCWRTRPSG